MLMTTHHASRRVSPNSGGAEHWSWSCLLGVVGQELSSQHSLAHICRVTSLATHAACRQCQGTTAHTPCLGLNVTLPGSMVEGQLQW